MRPFHYLDYSSSRLSSFTAFPTKAISFSLLGLVFQVSPQINLGLLEQKLIERG